MTRFITLTVQVRPHAESVELDGQQFTDPVALWNYLHAGASSQLRKPPAVRQSVFVPLDQLAALSAFEYKVPPGGTQITRVPARARELTAGKSRLSLEEMDL